MTPVRLDRSSWPAPARVVRIVHIGVGNFSRAHQAWYTARADTTGAWGIVGFTGRTARVADALGRQDGLYALIERGPEVDRLEVIDSICDVRPAADLAGLAAVIAAPGTAVVTLTVTEAGYAASPAPGDLPPVPARLAMALGARRDGGGGPLAIVSCDNVSTNGAVLRELTLAAAERQGDALRDWIEREISFVSTSVDRITPLTTRDDRQLVQRELQLVDEAPVVCEPFTDWVLSGEFPAGRPRWEDAGARFVADIEPWELRKLWLLNGGHSLLAYRGLLRGHATVGEAAGDRELVAELEAFWDLAQRHLPAGALDLANYRRDLKRRFANARISYPLTQIAGDGLGKLRNRVVPVIEAAMAAGEAPEPALQVIAAWTVWLAATADLTALDASAPALRSVLAAPGSADRTRGLLELLAPGWGSREELVAATERLRAGLGQREPGTHPQ